MNEDWRQVTSKELELVKSCGPNERCIVYGDEFIKLPVDRIESMYESAFKMAYAAALELADHSMHGQKVETAIDDMELGQTYMRVVVTDELGRQTAGIGMIPDPRPH